MRVFIVMDKGKQVVGVYSCATDAHERWKPLADGAVIWQSQLNADRAELVETDLERWALKVEQWVPVGNDLDA